MYNTFPVGPSRNTSLTEHVPTNKAQRPELSDSKIKLTAFLTPLKPGPEARGDLITPLTQRQGASQRLEALSSGPLPVPTHSRDSHPPNCPVLKNTHNLKFTTGTICKWTAQ